jgi:DNA-3-methyladenine glycosylase II
LTTHIGGVDALLGLDRLTFTVPVQSPFRLDLTVWALRRRSANAIDRWDGRVYRRILAFEGGPLELEISQIAPSDQGQLQVTARGAGLGLSAEPRLSAILHGLLGLQIDLEDFYRVATAEVRLRALAKRFRGLKPPRFPTLFEALVNGIACQQLTLTFGIQLLNSLAERYGPARSEGDGPAHAFPRPCDLAAADPDALRSLGFSQHKARAIVELAQAMLAGRLDLDALVTLDNASAVKCLCELRGVGRWTAEYVLLRGLGRLEVFPGDDVGARNSLRQWLGLPRSLDYAGVQQILAPWQPYAGLVYLHLLVDRLVAAGYLGPCMGSTAR